MIYHLHILYLLIIHLPFYTFQRRRRWWMQRWPYKQRLNIQRAFTLCFSQLFFCFYSFQQFRFLLLLLFMFVPLCCFSFAILCSFSIALYALMLMWTPKFWKCSQLPAMNKNHFQQLPQKNSSLNFPLVAFIFLVVHHFLINAWSSKLIRTITTSLCVPLTHPQVPC
jgi:hypothetical protein